MSSKPLSNLKSASPDSAGFTLLEVIISIMIMTFISLGIYQLTVETFRIRDVLTSEGEFYNTIRMAMDIVGRDVSAIYSPAMMKLPDPQASNLPSGATPAPPPADPEFVALLQTDAGRTSTYWLAASDKTGLRPSHFIGTDNKMSFVSASHVRIYRDSHESVFAKISYELVKDEGNRDAPDALMLVKTESTNAFDDDDHHDKPFVRKYPLLHGIKKFKYRYWRKDKDRWETSWDNDKEDYREKYPDIVEVTFEVTGPDRLSFEGIYKLRPEVPLRGIDPST